jgi:hypothetical protein
MNKPVKRLENQTFAILIPVFNPPAGWQLSLWERFSAFRQATGVEWHLAVIDDGSDRQLQVEVQWLTQQLGKQFTFFKARSESRQRCSSQNRRLRNSG